MDSITARRTGEFVEALLLAPVLRPIVEENGGLFGDYESDLLAQEIARHDTRGFAGALAAQLKSSP
jgi:hypothetical protein